MSNLIKIILIFSILLNIVAVWGFFHYIKYGGSPLGELKRRLTGSTKQIGPKIPYVEDNARIIKERTEGKADSSSIVFFGASITRRWDFEKYLPEFNMINRGVGGQLVPGMLSRYKRDVIDLKPEAVIIKFCSINIRPHIPMRVLEDGMAIMAQLAKTNDITPIVSTIIPAGKPEARISDFNVADSLQKFNDWVRIFAEQNDYHLIDFAKAIEDDKGFLPRDCSVDPVHVNEKGYEILSAATKQVIANF